MDLRQLGYLVAIADDGGFTRAAERLHVAQPGLSAQIGRLERDVGHRLFDRTPHGAVPTESGALLISRARDVLARVDGARAELDELTGLVRGRICLGLVRGAPLGGLAAMLGRFHREHPGVEMALREDESGALVDALLDGACDVALVGLATPEVPGLTTRLLIDDRLVVVVPDTDPWSGRRSVPLPGLVGRQVVALPVGTGMRTAFETACRRSKTVSTVAYEVSTVATALELVRAGLGVAVLPGVAVGVKPDLHVVPISRPVVRSRLALAWKTSTPADGRPAARAIVAAADEYARRSVGARD